MRFKENRDVTKQIGFDFNHVNKKHVNNFGFATDRDFYLGGSDSKPVYAVIGDSYVEAIQVKNKHTFHARLDADLEEVSVYPFGMSGSPLSQYLAVAEYTKKNFKPDVFIFLIINNDFDESWYQIKRSPGLHYFKADGSLKLIEYIPSKVMKIARKSAFVRYLYIDLKIHVQLEQFLAVPTNNTDDFNFNNKNRELGLKAVEHFVNGIQKLGPESKIIILLDGDRNAIYRGELERTPGTTNTLWYEKIAVMSSNIPNISVLDLHPIFQKDWSINKKKFNFEYDWHWNEHGHRIAADSLQELVTKMDY